MNFKLRTLAVVAALASTASMASAQVLNFDDLTPTQPAGNYFTTPYQGLTFGVIPGPTPSDPPDTGSWFYADNTLAPSFGVPSFSTSGSISISTQVHPINLPVVGFSAPITSSTPFVFNGATFTSLDDTLPVQYWLYLGATNVYTSAPTVLSFGQVATILSGYNGAVDTVYIRSANGYYALDDFSISAVPEPGTYALMLAGLGVVGFMASRRRKTAANTGEALAA